MSRNADCVVGAVVETGGAVLVDWTGLPPDESPPEALIMAPTSATTATTGLSFRDITHQGSAAGQAPTTTRITGTATPARSVGLFTCRRAAERCKHFIRDLHEWCPARRVFRPPLISYLRPHVPEQRDLRHGAVQAGHVAQIRRNGHRQ